VLVQIVTVVMNIVLAPVLIAGWGTGRPLGPAGAGLASSLAIGAGVLMMTIYFLRLEHYVAFQTSLMRFRGDVVRRVLRIGIPPGAEFALMFVYTGVVYYVIRDFGAVAQAGYGIGSRVMQSIFLPAMAVAFSAAPLAGQNVGAARMDRVRDTFKWASIIGCLPLAILTLACQVSPEWPIGIFTKEAPVVVVGADFLRTISWNFVATGVIFTCSGMFQALGNTIPSLISSATRLVTFALPALWMSTRPGFTLRELWLLSVVTVTVQAGLTTWFLLRELERRREPRLEPAVAG